MATAAGVTAPVGRSVVAAGSAAEGGGEGADSGRSVVAAGSAAEGGGDDGDDESSDRMDMSAVPCVRA